MKRPAEAEVRIFSYSGIGFDGQLVAVEVDIRRGIPGIDIVGLPDGAVREAKERVRVAIRNSGYRFPSERILVNLAPAGMRKEGAAFDLAIAVGILCASGQLESHDTVPILAMGELELSGRVRRVRSVLSAVDTALSSGIASFLLPSDNLDEGRILGKGSLCGIERLASLEALFSAFRRTGSLPAVPPSDASGTGFLARRGTSGNREPAFPSAKAPDFCDIRGQEILKRALEIAAAGGHHVFLFGPPGCGKTMAAMRFPGLLPDLDRADAVVVTRIYSNAGILPKNTGLIRTPPFRSPHHSASLEGLLGGGRYVRPGEVSLAHKGVLFLDEAPEFRRNVLQGLREPLEEGRVTISRAGASWWFPSDFQLLLAANPCPCGNLGREDRACLCSEQEIASYGKKLVGPLLDRIDIRVPVRPVLPDRLFEAGGESTATMRRCVLSAQTVQNERFAGFPFRRNARIPSSYMDSVCRLEPEVRRAFENAARQLSLSSRAMHSVLRIARTIADLDARETIALDDVYEAVQHRRYGDQDFTWNSA